eukprot:NODE_1776_length_1411_cov_26.963289_g1605_i0.p1 GENE.NODE_1776_length_1411_cov_26.963289_g1605_i0~~NODE_1776_length_1411_cov_26.963289_g1605_i0.p1  ORF type:complete len:401 (+),score=57.91 NODE_1776_length_1411_cov_26.963289_g1605_i0:157-1359(+)
MNEATRVELYAALRRVFLRLSCASLPTLRLVAEKLRLQRTHDGDLLVKIKQAIAEGAMQSRYRAVPVPVPSCCFDWLEVTELQALAVAFELDEQQPPQILAAELAKATHINVQSVTGAVPSPSPPSSPHVPRDRSADFRAKGLVRGGLPTSGKPVSDSKKRRGHHQQPPELITTLECAPLTEKSQSPAWRHACPAWFIFGDSPAEKSRGEVILDDAPFAWGSRSLLFRMRDPSRAPGEDEFVARHFRHGGATADTYLRLIALRRTLSDFSGAFNQHQALCRILIPITFVLECPGREPGLFAVEPFCHGECVAFTGQLGWGFTQQCTAEAFNHFVFCASRGSLLLSDLKGFERGSECLLVGAEIHRREAERDDVSSWREREVIFRDTHKCGKVCEALHLHL